MRSLKTALLSDTGNVQLSGGCLKVETVGGSIVVGSRGQHGTEEAGGAVCVPQAGSLK